MRTRLAEPIMPYAVDSAGRIGRWITFAGCYRVGAESEEFAAAGPVKGSRTRRVGAFRMLLLIERRSFQCAAAGRRLRIGNRWNRRPQFPQTLNDRAQPAFDGLFGLGGITVTVERIQSFSLGVERNVPARKIGRAH